MSKPEYGTRANGSPDRRTKLGKRKTGEVFCPAIPVIDGWTMKPTGGWIHGVHIIRAMPKDGKCPRCGVVLGEAS